MRPVAITVMRESTAVKELARAADIIENVRRKVATTDSQTRKGCEKVRRMVNGMIVELIGERDD